MRPGQGSTYYLANSTSFPVREVQGSNERGLWCLVSWIKISRSHSQHNTLSFAPQKLWSQPGPQILRSLWSRAFLTNQLLPRTRHCPSHSTPPTSSPTHPTHGTNSFRHSQVELGIIFAPPPTTHRKPLSCRNNHSSPAAPGCVLLFSCSTQA